MRNTRGNTAFGDKNSTKETIWNKRKLSGSYFFSVTHNCIILRKQED